jgi:ABC-type multidrug transport system ATPase subunit
MLEAINLTNSYNGALALDTPNLKIEGEIFCLLGANGAGKTTTINLFLNFIPRLVKIPVGPAERIAPDPAEAYHRRLS